MTTQTRKMREKETEMTSEKHKNINNNREINVKIPSKRASLLHSNRILEQRNHGKNYKNA